MAIVCCVDCFKPVSLPEEAGNLSLEDLARIAVRCEPCWLRDWERREASGAFAFSDASEY